MHLSKYTFAKVDNHIGLTCNRELKRTRPSTIEDVIHKWQDTQACKE